MLSPSRVARVVAVAGPSVRSRASIRSRVGWVSARSAWGVGVIEVGSTPRPYNYKDFFANTSLQSYSWRSRSALDHRLAGDADVVERRPSGPAARRAPGPCRRSRRRSPTARSGRCAAAARWCRRCAPRRSRPCRRGRRQRPGDPARPRRARPRRCLGADADQRQAARRARVAAEQHAVGVHAAQPARRGLDHRDGPPLGHVDADLVGPGARDVDALDRGQPPRPER